MADLAISKLGLQESIAPMSGSYKPAGRICVASRSPGSANHRAAPCTNRLTHAGLPFDLSLSAGPGPSVEAPVGSGRCIVGSVAGAALAARGALPALAVF